MAMKYYSRMNVFDTIIYKNTIYHIKAYKGCVTFLLPFLKSIRNTLTLLLLMPVRFQDLAPDIPS